MAGPGGREVGRLNVRVVPDTDGFRRKMEKLLEEYSKRDIDIKVNLKGLKKAREELEKLTKNRKVEIKVDLDDKKARAKMKALTKDRKVKITVDADAGRAKANIDRATRRRTAKINVDADTGKASAKINAVARDRKVKIDFNGDKSFKNLEGLLRDQVAHVDLKIDEHRAKARLKAFGRDNKIVANVEVNQNNLRQVTRLLGRMGPEFREAGQQLARSFRNAQREQQRIQENQRRIARDKSLERKYNNMATQLERQLRRLGSDLPERLKVDVDLDPRGRVARLRAELRRLEANQVNVEVDLEGERSVAARLAFLARDRRMRIHASLDRNNFTSISGIVGNAFKAASGVALGAMTGLFRGLSVLSSGLGNFGNIGQKVFGNLADKTSQFSGKLGTVASTIGQVVAASVGLAVAGAAIYAIVTALGAIVVAALSAVAALAAVVIGAAALLAIPAVFAGIGFAMISLSSKNSKLKKEFKELKDTMVSTFAKVGSPMLDFFTDSLVKMNNSLKQGSPLFKELKTGFDESVRALRPLRSSLSSFAFQTLSGFDDALKKLNKNGFFNQVGSSLSGLGGTIGDFASNLANYGPDISAGFQSLTGGIDRITNSLSNWIGQFSKGSPGVIDSFANATGNLLDRFSSNQDIYSRSARALGDALNDAVPGFEKLTGAFANMSPAVLDSISDAINTLGNTLSDSNLQQGLVALTTTLINLSGNTLAGLTKVMGAVGGELQKWQDNWSIFRGKLKAEKSITQKEFSDIIKSGNNARDKVNIGLNQLRKSLQLSSRDVGSQLNSYADGAVAAMNKVQGVTGQHVQKLAGDLDTLAEQWAKAGGKVGEGWYNAWQEASKQVDASGNSTLIKAKNQMQNLIGESQAFRERLKQNLIAALKADGVSVDDSVIAKIDAALGTMADSAGQKSQQAVANIQKNFALLPGIIQTAMNEAKTPEQLQQKLMAIQQVMNTMTPQIAEAFGKLPTSMQQTLAKSTAAFQSWTGLETFKQKVTTAVTSIVQQFNQLGPAIGQISGPVAGLGAQMGTLSGSFAGFNAQANWLNWIMNQIGAQAAWAGWQMGQFAGNASRAAGSVSQLNSGANGLQGAFNRAGASASTASAQIGSLGARASASASGFSAFAGRVSGFMVLAAQSVRDWTNNMLATLRGLAGKAGSAGNLSAFVSSVQSSMSRAQSTVSSAVSNMLAQLQRLNTTVTATVNINRNETTRKKTIDEGTSKNLPGPSRNLDVQVPFEAPAARGFDAAVAAIGRTVSTWRNSAKDISPSETSSSGGTTKNYNFNNTINGPAPTEKKLVKQLRFADALYGD